MIAVFDIDGVLADASHRQHLVEQRPKDWDGFFAAVGGDAVIDSGRARLAAVPPGEEVVLLSGRPERCRAATEAWLHRHGLAHSRLVLRPDTDRRRAADLKADLIRGLGGPGEVSVVVDDDLDVIARLRALGYAAEAFTALPGARTEGVVLDAGDPIR